MEAVIGAVHLDSGSMNTVKAVMVSLGLIAGSGTSGDLHFGNVETPYPISPHPSVTLSELL